VIAVKRFFQWLDEDIFPWVVAYFSHPLVILITLLLFIPMIVFSGNTNLILLLNSYMNVGSFGTSQIVLRQVKLTEANQEKRAQETHDWSQGTNDAVMEEIADIKQALALISESHDDLKALVSQVHVKIIGASEVDVTTTTKAEEA
jgi:hypothetical protein